LRKSKFGLWLDHRATVLFHNQKEVKKFQDKIDEIDLVVELIVHLNKSDNWQQLAEEAEVLNVLITNTDWLLAQVTKDLATMENNKDPLTRMFTRRYLPNIIQQEIRYCLENDTRLGIILLDLDYFKKINDNYGHGVGDAVLKQTAAILSNSIRPYDYIFRYGGEEFLIIINNTDESSCLSIAEHIRSNVEKCENKDLLLIKDPVTISLGVAIFDKHPDMSNLLITLIKHFIWRKKMAGIEWSYFSLCKKRPLLWCGCIEPGFESFLLILRSRFRVVPNKKADIFRYRLFYEEKIQIKA
jgi:diguanylate cyclase